MMHEFIDGCAAQYKSRHCIGDLSCSLTDFGSPIQRNYFETSHFEGEQDAAGSHVKQKVSQAVLRRTATIASARSMHNFLLQHFSQPATSRKKSVQRMSFYFYIEFFKILRGTKMYHAHKGLWVIPKLVLLMQNNKNIIFYYFR